MQNPKHPASRSINYSILMQTVAIHVALLSYTLLAVFPVVLIVVNSFKTRRAIFGQPFRIALPGDALFSTIGYDTVFQNANFGRYFMNSTIVTVSSLVLVLFCATMAAFALSEYRFPGNTLIGLYLSLGIMVPIRLGTVSILGLIKGLGLIDTLQALIVVYTAQGLPLAVFVLTQFFRQVPKELKDAARMDGASEYRIYRLVLPIVRPAIGTVAIFNMIPVWNDLWFPLILAPSEANKTVTLGSQVFIGQFVNDWNAVLSSLTLALLPVVIMYLIFSRQFIHGLTAGAVK